MTSFIDTHCHLDMLETEVAETIQTAQDAQVMQMITIAVDRPSIQFVEQIVQQWRPVFGSVGIHPHEAASYDDQLGEELQRIAATTKKIVAIGETGLDYHYMRTEKAIQQNSFRKHLHIAETLQLPVVLHTREAESDTLQILKEHPVSRKGVAHSFTGTAEMVQDLVALGWSFGINGIVTFRNAHALREVVRTIPLDRLLLETDAPYLTPIPFRGKPNDPSKVPLIAQFLAEFLEVPLEILAQQINSNVDRLFQLNGNTP